MRLMRLFSGLVAAAALSAGIAMTAPIGAAGATTVTASSSVIACPNGTMYELGTCV